MTKLVQPYFSLMAKNDKKRIASEFLKPNIECSYVRIVLATDAYGLRIDNPDIRWVVQWLLPPTMSALYQRLGRGMRCGRGSANYILLYPAWYIGSCARNDSVRGIKKTELERRKRWHLVYINSLVLHLPFGKLGYCISRTKRTVAILLRLSR